ncbi:MAG: RNA methyltransferase [Chitinophagales bacterium]
MKPRVYIALLHYPVYNKRMEVIKTSITNLDLHDIARTTRTYGVRKYFIVHPSETQKNLAQEILGYWQDGFGAEYNPDRKEAFEIIELFSSLEETLNRIEKLEGQRPKVAATDARKYANSIGYTGLRGIIEEGDDPWLIIFGTGWGLTDELVQGCDYILEPVEGDSDYNHLSVRAAAAIIIDRLLGEKWWT